MINSLVSRSEREARAYISLAISKDLMSYGSNMSKPKKYAGIYKIVVTPPEAAGHSVSSYTYIGKSNDVLQRYHQHQCALKSGTHANPRVQQLFDTLGVGCFEFIVIELVEDELSLERREVYWIQALAPSLNIMNTKFSPRDIEDIKYQLSIGTSADALASKYSTTARYIREILKGRRWGNR